MNLDWENQSRLSVAKGILTNALEEYKGVPDLELALRVYGHQTPVTSSYQDCSDTKLEVGFGPSNIDAIKHRIRSIEAKGATPIARSLEAAAGDFPDTLQRNFIILITDGLESCDNDPCVIAKKLKEKGVKVTPFVIGIGMDLSYLNQFNCIGTFIDAENKTSFSSGLKSVINKTLLNTTAQINLNDIHGIPNETNTTCVLYEAGTKNIKYTLMHTLNRKNLPDTLVLDPSIRYDILVKTLPELLEKNVGITKHTHNVIPIDAPQGYLKLTTRAKLDHLNMRVSIHKQASTINEQKLNKVQKYLVGKYDLEIFTLPRTYRTAEIAQSKTTVIEVPAPGVFQYTVSKPITGQVFVDREGDLEWVCNLEEQNTFGKWTLQPGKYLVVYREKQKKSTDYTMKKFFTITSNKTINLTL